MCGFPFKSGTRYLVFATRKPNGRFYTSFCSRTGLWTNALPERHALGTPRTRYAPVDPPPSLETFEAMLYNEDEWKRRSAISFWKTSDCGRRFLATRLDELEVSEFERRILSNLVAGYSTRSDSETVPDDSRRRAGNPFAHRVCNARERAWVRARIRDDIWARRFGRE